MQELLSSLGNSVVATSSAGLSTQTPSRRYCGGSKSCCVGTAVRKRLRHPLPSGLFFFVRVLAAIPSCLYTMHKYLAILKSFKHQGVPVWVEKTDQSDTPSFC